MEAAERRAKIRGILVASSRPVSAGALSRELGVSRQAIVGDVALLRASNVPIAATPRGYVLQEAGPRASGTEHTIACRHTGENMRQELYIVVDNGCGLLDVTVEHPVYGQLSGQLQIFSRFDADDFLARLEKSRSLPLCGLTGGVHLHTIFCPTEEAYRRVLEQLETNGILFGRNENDA